MKLALDPPVSAAQRRAMLAAKAGHSTLGIPKSVGEEFAAADPGGKLPAKARDMARTKWSALKRLLLEWIDEERAEPEHAADEAAIHAAGVAFVTPTGDCLFLRRAARGHQGDHALEWCFPGGVVEDGETPEQAARREAREEVGEDCGLSADELAQAHRHVHDGVDFTTFYQPVPGPFDPTLNAEHTAHAWAPCDAPPEPLHSGVRATLDEIVGSLGQDDANSMIDSTGGFIEPPPPAPVPPPSDAGDEVKHDPKTGQFTKQEMAKKRHDEKVAQYKKDAEDPRATEENARFIRRRNSVLRQRKAKDSDLTPGAGGHLTVGAQRDPLGSFGWAMGGRVGTGANQMRMSRAVRSGGERLASRVGGDMALDRAIATDKRQYDKDGRMHVDQANITKAMVAPYLGKEINAVMRDEPGWKMLDPDRRYNLLRPADEIAKAAKTFDGLPILWIHKPASAQDHPSEITIGATGNDSVFEYPYLKNSLSIWPAYASEAIEDGDQKQLSAGYSYLASMIPGEFEGQKYDGSMTQLCGNHIALVREGRSGSDVAIDEAADARIWRNIESALLRMGAPEDVNP